MATLQPTRPAARVRLASGPSPADHRPDVAALQAGSHRPEVQKAIREWIRRGVVRVIPLPGTQSRVRVILNPSSADVSASYR